MYFRVPFQPTGTNIVTNTAPTPGIRMRVVRRTGSIAGMPTDQTDRHIDRYTYRPEDRHTDTYKT